MKLFTYKDFEFLPSCFLDILNVSIEKEIGEHSRFYIKGVIKEEDQNRLIDLASVKQSVEFSLKGEKGKQTLFCGFMNAVRFHVKREVRIAEIEAFSFSKLMDIKKKNRSFHDPGLT